LDVSSVGDSYWPFATGDSPDGGRRLLDSFFEISREKQGGQRELLKKQMVISAQQILLTIVY
jgi:hypothetical protein